MTETYTSLGPAASWMLGAPFIASFFAVSIALKKRLSKSILSLYAGMFAFSVACCFFHWPLLWLYGVPILGAGIYGLFAAKRSSRKHFQYGFCTALILLGLVTASFPLLMGDPFAFVLKENEATSRVGSVARTALRLRNSSTGWYSEAGEGNSFTLGPSVDRFETYWGPNGVMSADAVGDRLTHWIGPGREIKD